MDAVKFLEERIRMCNTYEDYGGCPILAIGIKKACVSDWKEGYIDEHKPRNE